MSSNISWNIRGLRNLRKKSHLRNLIGKHKVDLVIIVKTKCSVSSFTFPSLRRIWGLSNLAWDGIDSVGLSGGIVFIEY
uniref:Uncharacterized protein n=1 Tax=Manihot esculenta TaxID=3983 RepID=A0A2C9WB67_MANES